MSRNAKCVSEVTPDWDDFGDLKRSHVFGSLQETIRLMSLKKITNKSIKDIKGEYTANYSQKCVLFWKLYIVFF